MTVTYTGGDKYRIDFYNHVVELNAEEIEAISEHNFFADIFEDSRYNGSERIEELTDDLAIAEARAEDLESALANAEAALADCQEFY